VEVIIHQQSKQMELSGLGGVGVRDNLEILLQHLEVFQSPLLQEELIGNK
jgi:hypothetical protein